MSTSARQAKQVLSRLDKRVHRALGASLDRTVDLVADRLKTNVPKATGELANSIAVEHAGTSLAASVTIGSPDEPGQAAAIEFGTSTQTARPYWRPAVHHSIPPAKADMHESFRDSI